MAPPLSFCCCHRCKCSAAAPLASPCPQFPTTLEKGLNKLMSLKDSFGGMVSQVSRMLGPTAPGGDDMVDQLLGKVDQLKVRA